MILRSGEENLDQNGNKSDDSESLLERRLKEEFSGHERVKFNKKSSAL